MCSNSKEDMTSDLTLLLLHLCSMNFINVSFLMYFYTSDVVRSLHADFPHMVVNSELESLVVLPLCPEQSTLHNYLLSD